jgi:hypothetical protein
MASPLVWEPNTVSRSLHGAYNPSNTRPTPAVEQLVILVHRRREAAEGASTWKVTLDTQHAQRYILFAMTPTLLLGRTDIAELLALDACLAAMEAVFRAHVTGQTLPPAIQRVVALFDAANGALPGLMDSVEITGLRMAAATAIAACHLGSEHESDPCVLAPATIRRHGHGTPDRGRGIREGAAPRTRGDARPWLLN